MITTLKSLPWNLTTKNLQGRQGLHNKIDQKIAKLETHLQHFPTGSVHLTIALERHPRKPLFTARLNLRVPSNTLHSEKSAPDIIKAFDDAVKALLRELQSLKAAFRREASWKSTPRREQLREQKTMRFAPPAPEEPTALERREELIRRLFNEEYKNLVRHARRLLRHDASTGEVPRDALDPREVVDEVSRRAIAHGARKPDDLSWQAWFYRLIHDELRRERRALKRQSVEEVSLERVKLPRRAAAEEEEENGKTVELSNRQVGPPSESSGDLMADAGHESPDEAVARKDLLEHLQHLVQGWSRLERDVFEFYYVEGFEPDEIAMIVAQPMEKVQETITGLQQHLRQEIRNQALV